MHLPGDVLAEIQRLTAVMKWRKSQLHVVYYENTEQNTMGAPVYSTGREIAGEDFLVAVALLEALLLLYDLDGRAPLEDETPYAELIIQEQPILPSQLIAPQVDPAMLRAVLLFAAILRYRKSVYHVRYIGDDGRGNPTDEYFEHPAGFSSGVDLLLLASMLETLGTHLGGELQAPQPMPLAHSYMDFYAAAEAIREEANVLDGSTVIAPGDLPAVGVILAANRMNQAELVRLADAIRAGLPRFDDLSSAEVDALHRDLKPLMQEFLAFIDPLIA